MVQHPSEFLKIAGQCLYKSKTGGGDRVTVASLQNADH